MNGVKKEKWWKQTYYYKLLSGKVEKEFYDITPKDAFYIWYRYKQKANRKRVNYDFWKLTRWEIRPDRYFEFLREEGYVDFIEPQKILSGENYKGGRKEFNIECDIFERCIEFKNKEQSPRGVYVRLNELIAHLNTSSSWEKFEEPKNPRIKFKRKPCVICGARSQKECICKGRNKSGFGKGKRKNKK